MISEVTAIEQAIHYHLDFHPGDMVARSQLADIYEETGRTLEAKVQRWMTEHNKHPEWMVYFDDWNWWIERENDKGVSRLPEELFRLVEAWGYPTRQEAERGLKGALESTGII